MLSELSPVIHQDIFDSIVQQLTLPDDVVTLRQCALVSRSFLTPVRKRLFSVVSLQWPRATNKNQYQKLHKVISDNPDIVYYIKRVQVHDIFIATPDHHLVEFLNTVAEVGELRELLFNAVRLPSGAHQLPIRLRQVLLKLVKAPNLHTFSFRSWCNCDISLDSIAISPRLKHLGLLGVDYLSHHAEPIPPSALSPLPHRLETLMIGGKSSQSVFQYLTAARSPLDISHIRSFTINGSEQELLSVTAQIFQLASSTIECFVWELPEYSFRPHVSDAPWYHPLNLRDLTHLQTLILVEYDWVQQLSIVYVLVTGCGLPNMLRNIVVMFQYKGSIISFDDLERTLQALKVDRALSAACYNSAHPLCITVWVFINDPDIDLETARNAVRSRFLKWFALTFARGVEVKGGIEMRSKLPEILERLQA